MAVDISEKRKFKFDDKELPDPDPSMSLEKVKALYAMQYPELTSAKVIGPKLENGEAVYTFDHKAGVLG